MGSKFLITQTLLSSWLWMLQNPENSREEFLKKLNREKTPSTPEMRDGIRFENLINSTVCGTPPPDNEDWSRPVLEISEVLTGAALQVPSSKEIIVNGITFALYGIMDALKAGTIYDIKKCSRPPSVSKYLNSPQHPMYLELCPEADRFMYLISDGCYVWKEEYRREDSPSILPTIKQFMDYLDRNGLVDLYCLKWESRR